MEVSLEQKVRLFWHGITTNNDQSIGNINIVPQDIGRLMLELINNALYVVDEKKSQYPDFYETSISVTSRKL